METLRRYSSVLFFILLQLDIGRMTQDILVSVSKVAGTLEKVWAPKEG